MERFAVYDIIYTLEMVVMMKLRAVGESWWK